MKAVMISIRPKWVAKIASGEKTIEVRKSAPKLKTPFKVYVYCTKHHDAYDLLEWHLWDSGKIERMNCKVVGEFVVDKIYTITPHRDYYGEGKSVLNQYGFEGLKYGEGNHCLTFEELRDYLGDNIGYAWHISDLKIYDKPKALSEFRKEKGNVLSRPFQSWGYVYD